MLCKNGLLKNFTKFAAKLGVLESLFNKVVGLQKKETPAHIFSCKICEICKNIFFLLLEYKFAHLKSCIVPN